MKTILTALVSAIFLLGVTNATLSAPGSGLRGNSQTKWILDRFYQHAKTMASPQEVDRVMAEARRIVAREQSKSWHDYLDLEAERIPNANASDPPQQVHIALAGDNGEGISNGMSISWVTLHRTMSIVRYGRYPGVYSFVANGTCDTYLQTWDHTVVLENLRPSTRYYYIVGDPITGWSKEFSFETAPESNVNKPINIMLYGDMGIYYSYNTRRAIDQLRDQFDLVWHVGDISYADDAFLHHLLSFHYEKTWNTYMRWMENITASKPYMVLPGNHEAECHSLPCIIHANLRDSLHNFTAYNYRFRMPFAESGAVSDMWYSFNYGPIHFINIDTETDFEGAPHDAYIGLKNGGFGDQLAWLEQDLQKASAERRLRPWIFVAGHRPVYSIGNTNKSDAITGHPAALAAAVEDLFYKYGVDVYFCGHQHSYERQHPVYKTKPEMTLHNPRNPLYIVQGAAGNTEGHTHYPSYRPAWNAFANQNTFGVGHLTVYNSTTISWKFLDSSNLDVVDEFVLFKQH